MEKKKTFTDVLGTTVKALGLSLLVAAAVGCDSPTSSNPGGNNNFENPNGGQSGTSKKGIAPWGEQMSFIEPDGMNDCFLASCTSDWLAPAHKKVRNGSTPDLNSGTLSDNIWSIWMDTPENKRRGHALFDTVMTSPETAYRYTTVNKDGTSPQNSGYYNSGVTFYPCMKGGVEVNAALDKMDYSPIVK